MLGRVIPGAWFGFVLVVQVMHLQSEVAAAGRRSASTVALLDIANTCLLLAYYGLLVGLYVVRLPHFDGDRRPHIAAASFAGTFLVTAVPFLPAAPRRDWLLLPADVATLAGILYALWSLLYLRRSFSILPQARRLVTGGPYALSRNPLYLGELVASWSVFLPTIAWAGFGVLSVNVVLQLVRVFAEERVLARSFGQEYAVYRRRVPRLFPRPWRLLTGSRRRPTGLPATS
jgi:protein-S-isoprenylcysteine O-methyltransferase Ste14